MTSETKTEDLLTSAFLSGGLSICGIAPKKRLATIIDERCTNCDAEKVVRRFSGSGWYDDDWLCMECGEDVGTGYRPFRPRWRRDNIETAQAWAAEVIPSDEFFRVVRALVRHEMGWDDEQSEGVPGDE